MTEGGRIEFRLLGPLEAVSEDGPIPLGGLRQRALLALLLLRPNEVVARDRLIEELWRDHAPESGANALAALVARLRRTLPPEILVTRAGGYEARIDPDALDLHRFERLAEAGANALAAGDATEAASQLRAALSLWRGPPLADFTYEPFAEPTIRRLEELRLSAMENRIDAELALERHADVVGELQTLMSEHPLRERIRGQLMLALYRAGRQAEALEVYRDGRATLRDELGIDPSPALQELEKAILRQDPDVQALTSAPSATPAADLPSPASSFVGRERELGELIGIVEGGARLVTVTGPGGTGKTRLALEAATALVPEYKEGVFFVGLASLREHALVTETIEQTLGAKSGLARYLGERELLLLLDNFEQVIEAAPELSALLEVCSNLTLLVTSRERLRVQGEVEYPVLGLAQKEAVDLFCARSRVEADATVAELCRRLDNLPLAVELAAARTSALSPEQILERLSERFDLFEGGRDADPRQQTLRATMEWSHELLARHERRLFARLAVFRGGCSLEAAEEVCQGDVDTLQSLVDKSLLRHAGERFSMLETIREYAAERLDASGEHDELRQRHAEHFLGLAEEAEPNLRGIATGEWLDRLEGDNDNLRAALDWLEEAGNGELALRMAAALWRYWHLRSPAEGWRRVESALRTDTSPTAARAKALNGAVALANEVGGDEATAKLRAEEALALHRTLGDTWGAAYSRFLLAFLGDNAGHLATAQQLYDESARLFRELGDEHYTLIAQSNLAWKCYDLGERERARALHEDTLARARATSNKRIEAISLSALAIYAVDEGRTDDALSILKVSLPIRRDVGDWIGLCNDLRWCSLALAVAGSGAAAAVRLLSRSEALREELGSRLHPDAARRDEHTLALVGAQLDQSAFAEAWEQGRTLTVDEAIASLDSAD